MIFKQSYTCIVTLLLCCCWCYQLTEASSHCSLERMKGFAMEACDHLFMKDEAREKRAVSGGDYGYGGAAANSLSHGRSYQTKHYTPVKRTIYPHGGYLKVGYDHFRKLSSLDVFPRYKAKKFHLEKSGDDGHARFKREHPSYGYTNIPYCCFHTCEEDFFC